MIADDKINEIENIILNLSASVATTRELQEIIYGDFAFTDHTLDELQDIYRRNQTFSSVLLDRLDEIVKIVDNLSLLLGCN